MSAKRSCHYNPNQNCWILDQVQPLPFPAALKFWPTAGLSSNWKPPEAPVPGWQDQNIWAGGGSAAAIVVEVILTAGKYNYSVPGKTAGSGFWTCGGNGGNAYFKSSSGSAVNFQVTGGISTYGSTKNAGGTVSSFTGHREENGVKEKRQRCRGLE